MKRGTLKSGIRIQTWVGLAAMAGCLQGGAALATTVAYPYLDVVQQGTDTGVSASGIGPTLLMQGTAVSIVNGPGSITPLATPATFTLSATYSASLTAADGKPDTYDYSSGTLTIGPAAAPLLTATFSDLVLQSAGTSLFNYGIATSSLNYTGGSLEGTLAGGNIVGSFTVSSATGTNGDGSANLSQAFTGSNLTAKVGAVVPLPAALPLMVSGFGVLFGSVRRRTGAAVRC